MEEGGRKGDFGSLQTSSLAFLSAFVHVVEPVPFFQRAKPCKEVIRNGAKVEAQIETNDFSALFSAADPFFMKRNRSQRRTERRRHHADPVFSFSSFPLSLSASDDVLYDIYPATFVDIEDGGDGGGKKHSSIRRRGMKGKHRGAKKSRTV